MIIKEKGFVPGRSQKKVSSSRAHPNSSSSSKSSAKVPPTRKNKLVAHDVYARLLDEDATVKKNIRRSLSAR
jgi:hypothetical protein